MLHFISFPLMMVLSACIFADTTAKNLRQLSEEKRAVELVKGQTTASGQSVEDWTEQCLQGTLSEERWQSIMKLLGSAIGKRHFTSATPETQKNLEMGKVNWDTFKTTPHGDLHIGNIFYDEATNQITLTNTASPAGSRNDKQSPLKDIADLYLKTKYLRFFNNKKGFLWLNDGFQAFAQGYAEVFPQPAQAALKKALMNQYQEWSIKVLKHINQKGFTKPAGNDVLSPILAQMIERFKADRLTPVTVRKMLARDEILPIYK
jgi:hypothetical protein